MKSLCPQTRKAALCVSLGELPVPGADRAWGLGAVTHRAGLGVGSLEPQPTLPPALLQGLRDGRGKLTAGGSLSAMSPDRDTCKLGALPRRRTCTEGAISHWEQPCVLRKMVAESLGDLRQTRALSPVTFLPQEEADMDVPSCLCSWTLI